ncbi:MAG TPA: RNA-binding cell elongation regulator Jag/EloR [Candidatus Angelobacter sp.]|nr:RNA-binding cell elongation regulator Jag/EloR [Candidatus Angelobacter sp.]
MKEKTVSGKSIEEAIQEALTLLGLSRENVEVEIIDEPKKGWLGIGSRPAKVRVTEKKDPIKLTVNYLELILNQMGLEAKVEAVQTNDREYKFVLSGEKMAIVIGKRGQTLNALQTLVNLFINQEADRSFRVTLDSENYRDRRAESLRTLAHRMAEKAIKTKRAVQLEPMPSYERKIIHASLQTNRSVNTSSTGEEPFRAIKIEPK